MTSTKATQPSVQELGLKRINKRNPVAEPVGHLVTPPPSLIGPMRKFVGWLVTPWSQEKGLGEIKHLQYPIKYLSCCDSCQLIRFDIFKSISIDFSRSKKKKKRHRFDG